MGEFNGHVSRHIDGFVGVQGNLQGRTLLEFCLEKELCVSNTWFNREEILMTFRLGEN